ncbi:MAG: hypothetical protein LBE49_02420 [Deltaproteobacteria bacterium]|jgi:TPR repeat protein|nr:hypothetical protein [Deltaproteobacteria bacterium]
MTALLLKAFLAFLAFLLASRSLWPNRPKELLAAEGSAIRQAAEAGDQEARYRLAWALENGYGEELNLIEAAVWYSLAAEAGHFKAAEKLEELIVTEAFQEALRLKKEAETSPAATLNDVLLLKEDLAALGTTPPGPEVFLERIQFEDRGVAVFGGFVSAADFAMGLFLGDPLCQFTAGLKCARGEFGVRDNASAIRWIGRSANGGYMPGKIVFAAMLAIGYNGTKPDLEEAFWSLKQAAEENESWAMCLLWRLRKIAPELISWDEALYYLKRAALARLHYAEYDMAMCMLSGEPDEEDLQAAMGLLSNAAAKGHEPSKEYLDKHFISV